MTELGQFGNVVLVSVKVDGCYQNDWCVWQEVNGDGKEEWGMKSGTIVFLHIADIGPFIGIVAWTDTTLKTQRQKDLQKDHRAFGNPNVKVFGIFVCVSIANTYMRGEALPVRQFQKNTIHAPADNLELYLNDVNLNAYLPALGGIPQPPSWITANSNKGVV